MIGLDDIFKGQGFAAFFAFLLVADRAVILFVQLVEADVLLGIDGVIDADGDGDEGELNVAFPD